MSRYAKGFVSAVLPLVAIALVHGCGGGGGQTSASPTANDSSSKPAQPAVPTPSAEGNRAPTLRAVTDAYARVGETFSFVPEAEDPEGDELRFSAVNLPPWASIDPLTGRISGTPDVSDEGVYEAITIAVTDAARRTESKPFSITVVGNVGTGVATLRWEAPPSKLDGSPLDDLAGYRILYGRSAEDLDRSVLINDPTVTTYEFTSLDKGIWYFAVVAVNSGGLEGPPTVITTKSI